MSSGSVGFTFAGGGEYSHSHLDDDQLAEILAKLSDPDAVVELVSRTENAANANSLMTTVQTRYVPVRSIAMVTVGRTTVVPRTA